MPIFEYVCKECNHEFEAIVYGGQKANCPKCHGKKLTTQLSVFAVPSKRASSAGSEAGSVAPCGSCGDERGPGVCSMPDFD